MSINVTVNCRIVGDGEFYFSYPLAPASAGNDSETTADDPPKAARIKAAPREDRVLPLGSSTLVPGLSVRLAD